MSIIDYSGIQPGFTTAATLAAEDARAERSLPGPADGKPLHRLAAVRRRQGVSRRTVARRLGIDMAAVKQQESPTTDVSLSTLYAWQEVLEAPISELLSDADEPLSVPVMKRAQLLRITKTAAAILERSHQLAVQRMAQMLIEQLCEIMPELAHVGPWHSVGRRRTQDELGQAAMRRLTLDALQGHGLDD
jgi:transcriptional regulator with XRE-family HTH domain